MTRRGRIGWPLLLALLGVLLFAAGLTYGAFQQATTSPGAAPLPRSIADLPLVGELTGPNAADHIAHLHRQQFPLSGAAVGTYRDGAHSATLWVSRSPLAPLAVRMERAMERAIATNASPFVPEETCRLAGRSIRVLTGVEQAHFYFRSGNLVIWLAADSALAEAALADTLAFYP